jgi:hypothetical protein
LFVKIKFLNENTYSHGRGKTCNFLNRPVGELVDFEPTIFLMIFFCKINKVKPRFNVPAISEILGLSDDFFHVPTIAENVDKTSI